MIQQGDLFWVDFGVPFGSEPGYKRPVVVIQNDVLNISGIATTGVCILTTRLRRANVGGNVLLEEGEGGLPERSVVVVSQYYTIDKSRLMDEVRIGRLSPLRVREIVRAVQQSMEPNVVKSSVVLN